MKAIEEGQTEICPIQKETTKLMLELQRLGQLQLLDILELVINGNYALAVSSVRVARQQLGSCQKTWELFERVSRLVYAAMCPHVAEEVKNS